MGSEPRYLVTPAAHELAMRKELKAADLSDSIEVIAYADVSNLYLIGDLIISPCLFRVGLAEIPNLSVRPVPRGAGDVASLVDPTKQNATPQFAWIRGLEIVVDARLDDDSETDWYLAADYNQVDTIEVAYLQGQRGAFIDQVGQYGVEYWKNRALMLVACEMADNGNQKAEQTANQFFAKTVALELALIEVCKQIRVDVGAIKKMASCPPDEAKGFDFPKVDAVLVKQYAELFSGLVPS